MHTFPDCFSGLYVIMFSWTALIPLHSKCMQPHISEFPRTTIVSAIASLIIGGGGAHIHIFIFTLPPVFTSNFNRYDLDFLMTLSRASRINCTKCKGRFSPLVRKLLNSPSVTNPL